LEEHPLLGLKSRPEEHLGDSVSSQYLDDVNFLLEPLCAIFIPSEPLVLLRLFLLVGSATFTELDGVLYKEFEWTEERYEEVPGDVLLRDIRFVLGSVCDHMADDLLDVVFP
jgi:hypothetical protein